MSRLKAVSEFRTLLELNRNGHKVGQYSVCSAHPAAIRVAIRKSNLDDTLALIESTSNQVDQYGGYTGMQPEEFADFVRKIAAEEGASVDRILLGGDHLGPNRWRNLPTNEAMARSRVLIERYVKAGFLKIHLDASMKLRDDPVEGQISDETVARRAAELCKVAEETAEAMRFPDKPLYVIGTEVPIPGGAITEESGPVVTTADRARTTIETTREAFIEAGLERAWDRVCALVVQPGVEFGDEQVVDYDPSGAMALSREIEKHEGLVFEAHSTDYQTQEALSNLVRDHFCILKVGPWLTYAYREALFALSRMEEELIAEKELRGNFPDCLDEAMTDRPDYWIDYYKGNEREKRYKRRFSYSDRARYYLLDSRVVSATQTLFTNLRKHSSLGMSLISQYFPQEYWQIRNGSLPAIPEALSEAHIGVVLDTYASACGMPTCCQKTI